ncbi:DUF3168 domain-containing protein [Xanthobacter sediminis]
MTPDLALQKALLARVTADAEVAALVPAGNVIDAYGVPQRYPCIIFADGQVVREPLTLECRHRRVYATLHVWTKSMPQARAIAGAITAAVEGAPVETEAHRAISTVVSSTRFLRDPDGETSHGVVTVDCLMEAS